MRTVTPRSASPAHEAAPAPAPASTPPATPPNNELLLTCRRCGTSFWTGIIIEPALRAAAGLPGDSYSCPAGHVEDYENADMFYDRRSRDRDGAFGVGAVDRRQRARRPGEL